MTTEYAVAPDIEIVDAGSHVLLVAQSLQGCLWLRQHCDSRWLASSDGGSWQLSGVAVNPSIAQEIVSDALQQGMTIQ